VQLHFAGKKGWKIETFIKEMLSHAEYGKRLFWHSDVDDVQLLKLYNSADCLIFASHNEGFGLPLVEAAQLGLPIIARDVPVYREICGDNVLYFGGSTSLSLKQTIENWIELFNAGHHPKSEKIQTLNWQQSCSQLLSALGFPEN